MPETPLTEDERAALEPLIACSAGRGLSPQDSAMAVGIERGFMAGRDFYSERERVLREALEDAESFIESVERWSGVDPDEKDEALYDLRAALGATEQAGGADG